MNIQEFPYAIMLTKFVSLSESGNTERYVYCTPDTGMLYEVDPANGTITGSKYILDISFTPIDTVSKSGYVPSKEYDEQDIDNQFLSDIG
jgi:hypothetical protein